MNKTNGYVCGISGQPLIYQTIGDAFAEAVEKWADKEAIVVCHQGIRWSYLVPSMGLD